MRLTIGLAACVLFIAAEDKGTKKGGDQITGTWKVTSLVANGEEREQAKGGLFMFKDGKLTMKNQRGDRVSTYKVDASKKPATIDMTAQGGEQDGMTRKGIFEVKGDELKLVFQFIPDGDRPKDFGGKEQGEVVVTLKRDKGEGADKPKEKSKDKE